jgi:hypothetical protein
MLCFAVGTQRPVRTQLNQAYALYLFAIKQSIPHLLKKSEIFSKKPLTNRIAGLTISINQLTVV